jgi:hypothetical protein
MVSNVIAIIITLETDCTNKQKQKNLMAIHNVLIGLFVGSRTWGLGATLIELSSLSVKRCQNSLSLSRSSAWSRVVADARMAPLMAKSQATDAAFAIFMVEG